MTEWSYAARFVKHNYSLARTQALGGRELGYEANITSEVNTGRRLLTQYQTLEQYCGWQSQEGGTITLARHADIPAWVQTFDIIICRLHHLLASCPYSVQSITY